MSPLEHELLQVYREALTAHFRERKLQEEVRDLRDSRDAARQEIERLEKRIDLQIQGFRELDERNAQLVMRNDLLDDAFEPCMELIGEVIKDEAFKDQFAIDISTWKMGESRSCEATPCPGGCDPTAEMKALTANLPESTKFVTVDPNIMPEDPDFESQGLYDGEAPILCLSCGKQKMGGMYMCDTCWDLDTDHGFALFEELVDAWGKGERNFPRPGKNAKELYKK